MNHAIEPSRNNRKDSNVARYLGLVVLENLDNFGDVGVLLQLVEELNFGNSICLKSEGTGNI